MLKKVITLCISMVFVFGMIMAATYSGSALAQCSSAKTGPAKSAACTTPCKTSCSTAQKSCFTSSRRSANAEAVKNMSTSLPYHESKRLVLVGEYVCGKCTLQKLDTCQGFVKTSDGSLYPLLNNGTLKGMCKTAQANAGGTYEFVGHVKIIDGVKYIDVNKIAQL